MDTRARNAHSFHSHRRQSAVLGSSAAIEEGRDLPATTERARREVANYFAGLRFIEENASLKHIGHNDIFNLHQIIATGVMDQGTSGQYRTIRVRVGASCASRSGGRIRPYV